MQYWISFDVAKQIVLQDTSLNHILSEMGLFTLHNCCASCSSDGFKSSLKSKSWLPILDFTGYLILCYIVDLRGKN